MGRAREFEGASLRDALDRASEALGIAEPELQFEILDPGRRGLFGLGVRSVRIRVEAPEGASGSRKPRPRPRQEERERPAEPAHAREVDPAAMQDVAADVQRMLDLMGLELTVEAKVRGGGTSLQLDGPDRRLLLQKDGELLASLQFLLNRMARRAWPGAGRIALDLDGYHNPRDEEVVELAREVAEQVARTGKPKKLQPMNPYERRLVHVTVGEIEGLASHSEGNGFLKRVRISPKHD